MMFSTRTEIDRNGVEYGLIDRDNHPDFDAVYACYQKCFPLPSEQESKENFRAILRDNRDATKPGREMWVYIKDKRTGEVLGADNFDAFPTAEGLEINGTCQDIYMFVEEKHRQQGIYSKLIELREQAVARYLTEIGRIPVVGEARICTFAEQNNPLFMTPAQYIEDSNAAIDQCVRRSIFERPIRSGDSGDGREQGFRTIQMRYVQPPLEVGGEICDYLDYVVKMPHERTAIPAEVVRGHLEQFFEKSFPRGTSLALQSLAAMKRDLEAVKDLPLEREGKFDELRSHLSVDQMTQVPQVEQNTRIGELRPELVRQHYGDGVSLMDAMGSYADFRQKTGQPRRLASTGGLWVGSLNTSGPQRRHLRRRGPIEGRDS